MPRDTFHRALPVASLSERLAVLSQVVAPTVGKGPIIRRRRVVGMAERLALDARAVRLMARLRDRYGEGPLLLPIPGRIHAVALSPAVALRVLRETPDPFSPDTLEKHMALGQFEPETSLISRGPERAARRRLSEEALEAGCPVHSLADPMLAAAEEEAGRMLAAAGGRLDWERFFPIWYGLGRRILLGEGARDDGDLTDLLARLRRRGNWVVLRRREDLMAELHERIAGHLARAEPGSIAARIAAGPGGRAASPTHQVTQYLFAWDPAGMATFRALGLLAAHRGAMELAREEAAGDRRMMPVLRATVMESLRLWPTTPAILRETTRDVDWDGAVMPKGTNILLFTPFLHRDPGLSFADRFTPELWLDEGRGVRRAGDGPLALVPFSHGPGICPAADLVPMMASAVLAALVTARSVRPVDPSRLRADRPLPGTLDPYTLRFALGPR